MVDLFLVSFNEFFNPDYSFKKYFLFFLSPPRDHPLFSSLASIFMTMDFNSLSGTLLTFVYSSSFTVILFFSFPFFLSPHFVCVCFYVLCKSDSLMLKGVTLCRGGLVVLIAQSPPSHQKEELQ